MIEIPPPHNRLLIGIGQCFVGINLLCHVWLLHDCWQFSCPQITCRRLAKALTVNRTVHSLHLDRNNAGDEFGIEMGKTIMLNNTLRMLDLGDNDIQATGACALAKALCNNGSLTLLNLSRNNMFLEWNGTTVFTTQDKHN